MSYRLAFLGFFCYYAPMITTEKTVSERALIQRINRQMSKRGETLKKTRGERWRMDLGDFYVVENNIITERWVDLEGLGQELGVLKGGEKCQP